MGKNVISGRNSLFWFDKWLGNFSLWEVKIKEINAEEAQLKVKDYWNGEVWKWDKFQHKLPAQVLLKFHSKSLQVGVGLDDANT